MRGRKMVGKGGTKGVRLPGSGTHIKANEL